MLNDGTDSPTNPEAAGIVSQEIPVAAYPVITLGIECKNLITTFFSQSPSNIFTSQLTESIQKLGQELLAAKWTDTEAAKVVQAFLESPTRIDPEKNTNIIRWVNTHVNDAESVIGCMKINPPKDVTIIMQMSQKGSQKVVFSAMWKQTQKPVVLKRLISDPDEAAKIMARELQAHPLSLKHENIIETHFLTNSEHEDFLVEEFLSLVLDDKWPSNGIEEAANLLFDIAQALNHLHTRLSVVHGDIKPDNIGKRDDRFILLDFGICRKVQHFTPDSTATGSLRTRAPELLADGAYSGDPKKTDIWALGATVYNAIVQRFPLFGPTEVVPNIFHPAERQKFVTKLNNRVLNEWDRWVDLSSVPSPMNGILRGMLEKDPNERLGISELLREAEKELAAFIRHNPHDGDGFSPLTELQQLEEYLPRKDIISLMPSTKKVAIKTKLERLHGLPGFDESQRDVIQKLLHMVGPSSL